MKDKKTAQAITVLMFENAHRYQTYLLTIWEERSVDPEKAPSWRFSLENTRNGKRRGFASFETLIEALKAEMGQRHEHLNGNQKSEQ